MTFEVYYKIKDNRLNYVGLAGLDGAKMIGFDSYEESIIFEDRLLRMMYTNEKVNNKMIQKLSKGGE